MDWVDEAIELLVESLCTRLENLRTMFRSRQNQSLSDMTNLAHQIDRITRVLGRVEEERLRAQEDGQQRRRDENMEEVAPRRGVVRRRAELEQDAEQGIEVEYERFRKRIRRSLKKMR
ncbi:hypothetical protein BSKO_06873 [Bryopsis sp. KO-2023]|nr:hypothetical protein BSKO_06873 [Bryopsis sp. KO-2023]